MKKHIIITLILLLATAFITVFYFKNLNPPGTRTGRIMRTIPGNAPLIFEFNNDHSFYDIFKDNYLLTAITGREKIAELDTLRSALLLNPLLSDYFTGQNTFISVHPTKTNDIDLLLTISAANGFEAQSLYRLGKQPNSGLIITPFRSGTKQGFNIYINALKKRFYVVNIESNIFSGSFSKELIDQCSAYKGKADKKAFVLLSQQQSTNSLANLYVNYGAISTLLEQLFKNKNTDIFKSLKPLPGLAALSLNYRSDALMFNGLTNIELNEPLAYLTLFAKQQPVVNHLKDIFPSSTAYSVNFSVSDPVQFETDLSQWHNTTGLKDDQEKLLKKIKTETGINLKVAFLSLVGHEFAILTTRYLEKYGIVSVKDGSKLKTLLKGVSTMTDENSGQLNYDKLPFILLGDSFGVLKKPYFIIIDNYLILANSPGELASFYDSYINRKFLSKNDQYNQFDNLLSERSNVAFFFQFKNLIPILKTDLYPKIYSVFDTNEPGWKNFYGASCQFTAADKNFYTNFCMKLSTDTGDVGN